MRLRFSFIISVFIATSCLLLNRYLVRGQDLLGRPTSEQASTPHRPSNVSLLTDIGNAQTAQQNDPFFEVQKLSAGDGAPDDNYSRVALAGDTLVAFLQAQVEEFMDRRKQR